MLTPERKIPALLGENDAVDGFLKVGEVAAKSPPLPP